MKKRILSLILAVTLGVSLCACGDTKSTESTNSTNSTNSNSETSSEQNDTSSDIIEQREFNYSFEGKYWYAEDINEAVYYNGFQYIYFKDGQVLTGGYNVVNNKMDVSRSAYYYATEGTGKGITSDYEMTGDSLILYKKHDDGGKRLDNGDVYSEISKEKFYDLIKMNLEFSKIPKDTYWKEVSSDPRYERIIYFDGTTLFSYTKQITTQQKYSIDDYAVTLDSEKTSINNMLDKEFIMDLEISIKQNYSLSNNILIFNDIVSRSVEFSNISDKQMIQDLFECKFFISIDEETAKAIIDSY